MVAELREARARADRDRAAAAGALATFRDEWQADTDAWVGGVAHWLRPGGRAIVVVGDGAGVDTLDSIQRAAAAARPVLRASGRAGVAELRVVASATLYRGTIEVAAGDRRASSTTHGATDADIFTVRRTEHAVLLEKCGV